MISLYYYKEKNMRLDCKMHSTPDISKKNYIIYMMCDTFVHYSTNIE